MSPGREGGRHAVGQASRWKAINGMHAKHSRCYIQACFGALIAVNVTSDPLHCFPSARALPTYR